MTGGKLGHYEILDKLGEGGMGVVYKARDSRLNRTVAIKLLPEGKATDAARTQRFLQEARAVSALNHPNIVVIHDLAQEEALTYLVMEYVPGKTLDQIVSRHGLSTSDALRYATQIAAGLTAAHEAGVIHRDLKPGNIMVTEKGGIKILDFGLAKLLVTDAASEGDDTRTVRAITEDGSIVGTVAYMSPEQAEGKPVDTRTDVFSFGAVLYEMLTGHRAFTGETKLSTLSAILRDEPKPVRSVVHEVPAELERIVNRCLRKDPGKRFQHFDDLQIALDELKQESDSGSLATPANAKVRRSRTWLWPAAALGAVAVTAAVWRYPGSNTHEARPPTLTRVTSDAGLTTHPALSSDGKLLAYASDRGTDGDNLDIWIQHVGGGDAVRLTKSVEDEFEPAFSADGSRIAFTSGRGGIYVVPVLGGEVRQLVARGSRARFSPDGNWMAYHVTASGSALGTTLGEVWIIPSGGGAARRIAPNFQDVSHPVWSPDSRRLLVIATPTVGTGGQRGWWSAAIDGGEPGLVSARQRTPVSAWTGSWLLFSAQSQDYANLWRVRIDSSLKVTTEPERLTFGTAYEEQPAVDANGAVALASTQFSSDLWMLPIEAGRAKVSGELQRLTQDAARDHTADITPDGAKVIFLSDRGGDVGLWAREMPTGKLVKLSPPGVAGPWPKISSDGRKASFAFRAPGSKVRYVVSDLSDGTMQDFESSVTEWGISPSGGVLIRGGGALTPGPTIMRVQTKETHVAAVRQPWQLLSPSFSPDERWLTLHARNSEFTRQIYIIPYRFGRTTPYEEWIPITNGRWLDRDPAFSPDGGMLYWLADRNGVRGIYARKLDPATKRPLGPEFEVRMFRGTRRSMMGFQNSGLGRPAVAKDKIVFALGERTGNIWMTKLPQP